MNLIRRNIKKVELSNKLTEVMNTTPFSPFNKVYDQFEDLFTEYKLRPETKEPKNILLIQLNAMGDLILSSGFIREIRKMFPDAHITLVCLGFWASLLKNCPYVDKTISCFARDDDAFTSFQTTIKFCQDRIWGYDFDVAINLHWGLAGYLGSLLAWLSGAPTRIGFNFQSERQYYKGEFITGHLTDNDEYDRYFLTDPVQTPYELYSEVEKKYFLLNYIKSKYNIDVNVNKKLELWIDDNDKIKAKELLNNAREEKIIIGLGASYEGKKYPVNKLYQALLQLHSDKRTFILVGGEKEETDAQYLYAQLVTYSKDKECCINLVNKTSLRETAAVISLADMYVGNDTGCQENSI